MNKKKVMLSHIVAGVLVSQFSLLANDTNTIKLEEVTVTSASGHEQKITDAPASISVISQEDLSKKPYTNLLDAVKDIEGIDIGETRDKSGQGGVSIRGMGAELMEKSKTIMAIFIPTILEAFNMPISHLYQ
jgi:outer membrane receptor for ferrienterochelin and colicins